jgi:glycosyltransferase involved in cell wall biosynthesis
MINVLHLIDTGGPGGAETVFLRVATDLDPERFRAVAAVSRAGWLSERLEERGLRPEIVPASGSINIRYLRSILALAKRHRIDVILAHLYGSAIYASLAGLAARIPVVSVLHGQSDVDSGGRLSSLKAAAVRHGSRRTVFVSEQLRDALASSLRLPASRCVVIPNGVDTVQFSPGRDDSIRRSLGLGPETVLIGAIGNIRAPKAYDVLLAAAHRLVQRGLPVHFVIAGENSGALGTQLLEQRRKLGLEARTTFLGLRADVSTVLHNLDIFALSSRTEGFSIACIEAMACGIPVVATRSGGPQQILTDTTGLLVAPGNPEELAQGIEALVLDPARRRQLAVAGPVRVREHFSLRQMLHAYENLLADLAAAARASA